MLPAAPRQANSNLTCEAPQTAPRLLVSLGPGHDVVDGAGVLECLLHIGVHPGDRRGGPAVSTTDGVDPLQAGACTVRKVEMGGRDGVMSREGRGNVGGLEGVASIGGNTNGMRAWRQGAMGIAVGRQPCGSPQAMMWPHGPDEGVQGN
jgi:hypothetical protein